MIASAASGEARVEVGVGVGLRGGADVAALDVEQHQRAGLAGAGDHPLEDGDAAAAEALVERRLRLDDRDVPARRASTAPSANRSRPATSSASPHCVEQRGVRVDAGAELAALGDGGVQPGSERLGRRGGRSCGVLLELGDEPVGGRGVVEQRGADLDGAGPGAEERAHVVGGGDAAARRRPARRAARRAPRPGSAGRAAGWPGRSARRGGRRASRRAARCRPRPRRRRRRARCGRSRRPGTRRCGAWPAPACRAAGRGGPPRRRWRRGRARGRRRRCGRSRRAATG